MRYASSECIYPTLLNITQYFNKFWNVQSYVTQVPEASIHGNFFWEISENITIELI
jgi:hypothetical protein